MANLLTSDPGRVVLSSRTGSAYPPAVVRCCSVLWNRKGAQVTVVSNAFMEPLTTLLSVYLAVVTLVVSLAPVV